MGSGCLTLEEILDSVQRKHGALGRVWVFDRGIVSEENLALLRQRGLFNLVATPRRMLGSFEKELLKEDWSQVEGHPQIQVKSVARDEELYVLTRSLNRAEKERAIRLRMLHGLRKDLAKLSKAVRSGRVRRRELIYKRLGRLEERWPTAWPLSQRSRTNRLRSALELGPKKASERLAPSGHLSVAHQPNRSRSATALAAVHPTDRP
jgi:hypothetical protein